MSYVIGSLATTYAIVCVWGTFATVAALLRMQRSSDPLLIRAGIMRVDGGPKCILGVARLAFAPVGDSLPGRVRRAMQIAVVCGPLSSLIALAISRYGASPL